MNALSLLLKRNSALLASAPLSALLGILIILIYCLVAALAPFIAPYGEAQIVSDQPFSPWSAEMWLGGDQLGRDVFSRLLYGARNTITIALAATLLAFIIGTALGMVVALVGGWLDQVLAAIVDAVLAIPSLIFALILLVLVGTSLTSLILIIAALDAARFFRIARTLSLNVSVMDFVEVSRVRGEGNFWVLRNEILPNIMPVLVAEFGLRFCFVFLKIAALSFLGLGIQPPMADWGGMVRESAPLLSYGDFSPLIPALVISVFAVAINFVVDWYLDRTSGLTRDGNEK